MAKRKTRKTSKGKSHSRKTHFKARQRLPKAAVTLVVNLRAREGQDLLLEAELRALVGPTRREQGCLTYDLYRGADLPGAFLLHEVWASLEHHRLHMQTPHFLRWNARKDTLLAMREATFWKQIA
jgi:quinol monooxygenase YgiN